NLRIDRSKINKRITINKYQKKALKIHVPTEESMQTLKTKVKAKKKAAKTPRAIGRTLVPPTSKNLSQYIVFVHTGQCKELFLFSNSCGFYLRRKAAVSWHRFIVNYFIEIV